jgi:hypothetical protein
MGSEAHRGDQENPVRVVAQVNASAHAKFATSCADNGQFKISLSSRCRAQWCRARTAWLPHSLLLSPRLWPPPHLFLSRRGRSHRASTSPWAVLGECHSTLQCTHAHQHGLERIVPDLRPWAGWLACMSTSAYKQANAMDRVQRCGVVLHEMNRVRASAQ